jgi:Domain of unknown function (DUF4375)
VLGLSLNYLVKEYLLDDLLDAWFQTPFGEFAELSEPRQVFVATWDLWQGVNFDGLCIYFHNKTYSLRFAVQALTAIGAHATAATVSKAISLVFPNGIPESDDFIRAEAERIYFHDPEAFQIREALAELKSEFDLDPDRVPLLMFDFVRKYPAEFFIPEEGLIRAENAES